MNIETKFKPGDKFWAMKENKAKLCHISVTRISVSLGDIIETVVIKHEAWTEDSESVGIVTEGSYPFYQTKEELIASL